MLRASLILAVSAGLAAGALAWWAAGGRAAAAARIAPLEQTLGNVRAPKAPLDALAAADAAQAAANPLFILTTGPGAVPAPTIRLDGVSRNRGRIAALVSINDQPAEWLVVGDARNGVRLEGVTGSRAMLDTVYGPQEVGLGERVGANPPPGAETPPPPAPGAVQPSIVDQPPPGFRSPPPPASAPGRR